jgi:hypothetical protein
MIIIHLYKVHTAFVPVFYCKNGVDIKCFSQHCKSAHGFFALLRKGDLVSNRVIET